MLPQFRLCLASLLVLATLGAPTLINPGLRTATAVTGSSTSTPLPVVETDSFPTGSGDVADDPAIWVDTLNPGNSVVIVDNKADSGGGLGVFDMKGKLIHFKQDGKMGNVDLREGFVLSGKPTVLVGTNNRSSNTIALYAYDTVTRTLSSIHARSISTVSPNYGFCMYHSSRLWWTGWPGASLIIPGPSSRTSWPTNTAFLRTAVFGTTSPSSLSGPQSCGLLRRQS